MTKVNKLISSLADHLSRLESEISHLRSSLPSLSYAINEWKRIEQKERDERVGRYSLGQHVSWRENRNKTTLSGTVVGIVPARTYPSDPSVVRTLKTSLSTLRYRGYYRYEESYLVKDREGKLYWPRVNSLTPTK